MRSLSDREGRTGDLSPALEGLGPMAAMVGIGEISGAAEVVGNLIVDGEEPLSLPWVI